MKIYRAVPDIRQFFSYPETGRIACVFQCLARHATLHTRKILNRYLFLNYK